MLECVESGAEVLDQLDWDAVATVISESNLLTTDKDDVAAMVHGAASRYLPSDFDNYDILAVERRWHATLGEFMHHGTWDLVLRERASGVHFVADWKTTASLDKEWADRLTASWQNRIYSWSLANEFYLPQTFYKFHYRGIQRPAASFAGSQRNILFRDVTVLHADPVSVDAAVVDYLSDLNNYRKYLHTAERRNGWWPRNMPFACGAYGRECAYYADCRKPEAPEPIETPLVSLNYSGAQTLMLCPEKYRRELLAKSEGSDETAIGSVFHAAMECIYKQAQALQPKA